MPTYFDCHTHLNLLRSSRNSERIVQETLAAGVWFTNIGADLSSSKRAVEMCQLAPEGIYATAGIHPEEKAASKISRWPETEALAADSKVVAIGECGLDYGRITKDELRIKSEQKELFQKHIDLALKTGKPLMIHCRPSAPNENDAYEDLLAMIVKVRADHPELAGNLHFFVGNLEIAKRFVAEGFTLSFTGLITYNHQFDEVIKWLPADRILAETDAPWVAPVPHRGERNQPAYVKYVVAKMAELRGVTEVEMAALTTANARRFYGV